MSLLNYLLLKDPAVVDISSSLTDCGALTFKNETVREIIKSRAHCNHCDLTVGEADALKFGAVSKCDPPFHELQAAGFWRC